MYHHNDYTNESLYVVSIIIYYIIILAILFGNFKIMKERQYRQRIEEKSIY